MTRLVKATISSLVAASLAGLIVSSSITASAAVVERLPDLKMLKPSGLYIQNTTTEKRLRFTTIITNAGTGKFDVRGSRPSTAYSRMSLKQRIYRSDGTYRSISIPTTDSWAFYAGDGHAHWHVYKLQHFTIRPAYPDGSYGGILGRGAKTGFCFFDNTKINLGLPYAPQTPSYTGCGSASSLSIREGLSVGWGDKYSSNLAYQWIKINGLKDGLYRVTARADPGSDYLESNESNNASWVTIRLTGNTVTVV
jgi:Lysyl oxidase